MEENNNTVLTESEVKEEESNVDEELKADDFKDEDLDAKKEQSRERNAEEARKRRAREQKERAEEIRKQAFEEGKKAGQLESNKLNSYTGKAIEDDEELEIFKIQQQIEKEGGDPLKDLPRYIAKQRKELKNEENKKKELQDKANKDVIDFVSHFATREQAKEVLESEQFSAYSRGKRGGDASLYDIYKEFTKLFPNVIKASGSTPPSQKTESTKGNKDTSKMSRAEYDAYFREKYGG